MSIDLNKEDENQRKLSSFVLFQYLVISKCIDNTKQKVFIHLRSTKDQRITI